MSRVVNKIHLNFQINRLNVNYTSIQIHDSKIKLSEENIFFIICFKTYKKKKSNWAKCDLVGHKFNISSLQNCNQLQYS